MLKKKKLTLAVLTLLLLMSACGQKAPEPVKDGTSQNEIVTGDNDAQEPEDDDDDDVDEMLEKPAEELRINVNAVVVGDCTGIGLAPIMGWGENDKNHEKYSLTVAENADAAAEALRSGTADIAVLPLDKAVKMYGESKDVVILATNTYNNIYIADTTNSVKTKADLSGKTVALFDDGSLTSVVEKKILEASGAQIQNAASNEAIQAGLADGSIQFAIVPEPYITLAKIENDDIEMGPDVSELWAELDVSRIVSSVLVARKDFVENNADSIIYILDDFEQSVNTVVHAVTKTLDWTTSYNIMTDRSVAISTMKNCNYTFTKGSAMYAEIESFLMANEAELGSLPDKDFYYLGD